MTWRWRWTQSGDSRIRKYSNWRLFLRWNSVKWQKWRMKSTLLRGSWRLGRRQIQNWRIIWWELPKLMKANSIIIKNWSLNNKDKSKTSRGTWLMLRIMKKSCKWRSKHSKLKSSKPRKKQMLRRYRTDSTHQHHPKRATSLLPIRECQLTSTGRDRPEQMAVHPLHLRTLNQDHTMGQLGRILSGPIS